MYKIAVYAIAKNEEKFVNRWVESMKEADYIYVLDTGSTDQTVNLLKNNNIIVKQEIINPWRFDVARNKSLEMVPEDIDICVCTDLDEVFEKGWRKKLEEVWDETTTCLQYNYNWLLDENNIPKVNFYIGKIHKRFGYIWTHPVHEVLKFKDKNEIIKITNEITLNHYPDKNKPRSQYLPLLELSIKEQPFDDRNMHYLGREYMYYGKWNECIDTLIRHLNLESATWKDERCASMRFISRAYQNLKRYDEAKMWLDKAIKEAPYLRDPYVERALLEYNLKNWLEVDKYCKEALKIKSHIKNYINESFSWDHTIYDLLSISKFYQNDMKSALIYSNEALKISPKNERLLNNNKLIKENIFE